MKWPRQNKIYDEKRLGRNKINEVKRLGQKKLRGETAGTKQNL